MNKIYRFELDREWASKDKLPPPNTIFRYLGGDFNIDTQLYTIVFEEVGLPVKEKIYVVMVGDVPDIMFIDKAIAHDYASKYTDLEDYERVSVVAYEPVN